MEEEEELFRRIAPDDATHVVLHMEHVPQGAFLEHPNIIEVICRDGVKKIELGAFHSCQSLRRVVMPGVKILERCAFIKCHALTDVECNMLEIIREWAFGGCESLGSINLPSARIVEEGSFAMSALTDVTFGDKLERIDRIAFCNCFSLKRITIPLKDGLFTEDDTFQDCENLRQVDLIEGEVHATIASFDFEEWRDDMNREIDSINQILPNACAGYYDEEEEEWIAGEKARTIRTWIRSVIDKMNHYKAEHQRLLNEAATLLEMAMWKANLDDNNGGRTMSVREGVRTTRGSVKRARRELCITSGASTVIKNVLPFLELKA
jgi:hypothetical protein